MPVPRPADLPQLELAKAAAARAEANYDSGLDSARRRAAAAAAAGNSLSGGAAAFDDPQTHRYSYEHITSARDSLNPVCKELYLAEEDFQHIFGMDKMSFYSMKLWKQRELKKRVGLF